MIDGFRYGYFGVSDISPYVSLVMENATKVLALIEEGAIIYVCGDGSRMEPDVKRTLVNLYRAGTASDEASGEAWMSRLVAENRYVLDVWASS